LHERARRAHTQLTRRAEARLSARRRHARATRCATQRSRLGAAAHAPPSRAPIPSAPRAQALCACERDLETVDHRLRIAEDREADARDAADGAARERDELSVRLVQVCAAAPRRARHDQRRARRAVDGRARSALRWTDGTAAALPARSG
jgi:hypothetical protein